MEQWKEQEKDILFKFQKEEDTIREAMEKEYQELLRKQ